MAVAPLGDHHLVRRSTRRLPKRKAVAKLCSHAPFESVAFFRAHHVEQLERGQARVALHQLAGEQLEAALVHVGQRATQRVNAVERLQRRSKALLHVLGRYARALFESKPHGFASIAGGHHRPSHRADQPQREGQPHEAILQALARKDARGVVARLWRYRDRALLHGVHAREFNADQKNREMQPDTRPARPGMLGSKV